MSALARLQTPFPHDTTGIRALRTEGNARKTILVVDGDESARSVIAEVLCSRYDVYAAEDGLEALVLARRILRPSLVISELDLPNGRGAITGLKLAKLLKLHPDLRAVPFVFVTERLSLSQADIVAGIKVGARRYLGKPFVRSTLFDVVTRIVDP